MAQLRVDFQEMLQGKEEQEDMLHRRERELSALKGALKEEVETHDTYMTALKDEYENELEMLLRDLELAKEVKGHDMHLYYCSLFSKAKTWFHHLLFRPVSQSNALLGQEKDEAEEERSAAKVQLKELSQERDQLRGKVQELNNKVDQLSQAIQESKATERLLEQREKQLEVGNLMEIRGTYVVTFYCYVSKCFYPHLSY